MPNWPARLQELKGMIQYLEKDPLEGARLFLGGEMDALELVHGERYQYLPAALDALCHRRKDKAAGFLAVLAYMRRVDGRVQNDCARRAFAWQLYADVFAVLHRRNPRWNCSPQRLTEAALQGFLDMLNLRPSFANTPHAAAADDAVRDQIAANLRRGDKIRILSKTFGEGRLFWLAMVLSTN